MTSIKKNEVDAVKKKQLLKLLCIFLAITPVLCALFVPMADIAAAVISLDCDANGDGVINGKDIIRLLKYIKEPEKYPYSEDVDVNGDGVISRDDIDAIFPFFDKNTKIIENGQARYSVLCASDASDNVIKASERIIDGIYSYTGVLLELVYDTSADMSKKYIIVGDSSLEDSLKIKASFNNAADTYAVGQTDTGNIVVIANYDDHIITAADYYVDNLLKKNYDADSKTLIFRGYYNKGEDLLPDGFSLAELSKTKIVYATDLDGYRVVAETLRAGIKNAYNINVPIYPDDECPISAREILIGHTNREMSEGYYANDGYIMEYDVTAKNGKLQILCGGSFTARKATEYLLSNLFKASNASKVLGVGRYTYKNLLASSLTRSNSADVRIMTLNIMPYVLGEAEYANVLPVRERAEIVAGMLISSAPDVVGLQEACYKWQEQLPHYIEVLNEHYGIGYKFVLSSHNGRNNYTPMIYRADKYDALVCKYQHYDYHTSSADANGTYLRGAAQLVLQNKNNSSEKFIVINSHWDHAGQLTTARPYQMNECASSEAAIVNAYKTQYPGVRIFCVGDFNSHRYNGIYLNQFCKDIDGTIASDAARTSGTLKVAGGYHGSGSNMNEYGTRDDFTPVKDSFIDHIIFTSSTSSVKTSVLSHNTLYSTSGYFHIISDHCPVYADFEFTVG